MIGLIFNLCVSLLFAAFLIRAVRRFERRADAVMERMDRTFFTELKKYDEARDEIRASMRASINASIAELNLHHDHEVLVPDTHRLNGNSNGSTETQHAERSI